MNWCALQTGAEVDKIAQFMQIYRSREVGQSYFTSVWTTLVAIIHALWLMLKLRPQVVFLLSVNLLIYMRTSFALESVVCFVADSLQWPRYLYSAMRNCILI